MRSNQILIGAIASLLLSGTASAQDLLLGNGGLDPAYGSSMFRYEGFYAGGSLGIGTFPKPDGVGVIGVVAGTNYTLTESLLAGVEFQGDLLWNGDGIAGADALALGKFGGYILQDTLLYGTAGLGWAAEDAVYALGAGVEQPIAANMSVRGEGLLTGGWGNSFDGGKAAVSLLWHMN